MNSRRSWLTRPSLILNFCGDVLGAMAEGERVDEPPVPLVVAATPGREVDAEGDLIGDLADGVVGEGLGQRVRALGAEVRAACRRRSRGACWVISFMTSLALDHAGDLAAALDGLAGEVGQTGDEAPPLLAGLVEFLNPLPAVAADFLDLVLLGVAALDWRKWTRAWRTMRGRTASKRACSLRSEAIGNDLQRRTSPARRPEKAGPPALCWR